MKPDVIAEYDRTRDFTNKAVRSVCYAPHTNIFFDQQGRAKACCWNWEAPLGHVQTHTIDQIWRSAQARMLRDAVEHYDLRKGCQFCEKQTSDGWVTKAVMRNFDQFAVDSADPQWPQRLELSISNSCNLECVMCNGLFSTAIRSKREKLPPVAKIYPDDFVPSLRKYLPHLNQVKFLGGEPLLVKEYYDIWEMMIEDSLKTRCHVTTNGTVYNKKFERIMQALPISFSVSLDGATKETVESIRVNAVYEEQLEILKRLRDYTRERKTDLSLTYCFMRQNWHEFGEYCLFADEWGCNVGVNTVANPPQFGVYNLPAVELRKIVDAMELQAPRLDSLLNRNRGVWFAEFERISRRCASLERSPATA